MEKNADFTLYSTVYTQKKIDKSLCIICSAQFDIYYVSRASQLVSERNNSLLTGCKN